MHDLCEGHRWRRVRRRVCGRWRCAEAIDKGRHPFALLSFMFFCAWRFRGVGGGRCRGRGRGGRGLRLRMRLARGLRRVLGGNGRLGCCLSVSVADDGGNATRRECIMREGRGLGWVGDKIRKLEQE